MIWSRGVWGRMVIDIWMIQEHKCDFSMYSKPKRKTAERKKYRSRDLGGVDPPHVPTPSEIQARFFPANQKSNYSFTRGLVHWKTELFFFISGYKVGHTCKYHYGA